ncbi:MAG: peptidase M16 [Desulfobulbus propionicus]|nr:MAG: peptidase M16 [Desulfobulbus propionicus]
MTEFIPGEHYHDFLLIEKQSMDSLQSDVFLFRHKRLGCKVMAIKNSDPNKTFCIAFKTIPQDSTGVAHILEHSVLMGSQKYPVKDVFGEINKGGLMTYLNALTGSDTTWYPFATRTEREYYNIMDVYCDVVFNPLLLKSTFEQEGWHYHLEQKEQNIHLSGVVYNEMKGVFSDPVHALFHKTIEGLLPGSTYAHESGGNPANIPDLSYEAFTTFHKNHYHPSNCTLFFYGNADLNEELRYVAENFLHSFDQPAEPAVIDNGDPIDHPRFLDDTYPVQADADLDSKTYLAVSSLIGAADERIKNTAFQIIAQILYNSDASPLKNAIVEAKLCKDFGGLFLANIAPRTIMMTYLIGSDPDKGPAFQRLYQDTLADIVAHGLDQELILAELNKFEFNLREQMNKAQRGLDLIGKALSALKYDLNPFTSLDLETILQEIRQKVDRGGYFEQLIQEYLLDNPATVCVTLRPDPARLARNQQIEHTRLQQYADQLTAHARQNLVARTKELLSLQTTPNDRDSLALLPTLDLGDLDPEPQIHQSVPNWIDDTLLLVNELPTNGICYIDFGFDCTHLPIQTLPYLDLFGLLMTELGTPDLDYRQFAKQLNIYTGGFSHSFHTYRGKNGSNDTRPILWFSLKTLASNLDHSLDLIQEVFRNLDLANTKRIEEIVHREFAWAEHAVQSEGYGLAATRVFSHLSTAGLYNEYVSGASAYRRVQELAQAYARGEKEFLAAMHTIRSALLIQPKVTLNITAESQDILRFEQRISSFLASLPEQGPPPFQSEAFQTFAPNQAFRTSSEVVFNVQGCTLFQEKDTYRGSFEVLKTWISRDYLWNTVRQVGGAYGCFVQFNHLSGNFCMISYRDPQVDKTYSAYNGLQAAIERMRLSPESLKQLIIGTYGTCTPHQGPATQGVAARNDYLNGVDLEFKQQKIQEILHTTPEELYQYASLFNRLITDGFRATIGNGAKINAATVSFDNTVDL